jgi:branched-chain amino acid aminotransferase
MSNSRALKTVTSINGRIVPLPKAKVSVFDNSLLYAEGLFETFLAVDERLLFLELHIARLLRGAKVIGLRLPTSGRTIVGWMEAALRKHPSRIKKLRLTVTAGESARWLGIPGPPQIIIGVSPHELPRRPFKLYVSPLRVDHRSTFRRIKTLSYAIHAAALRQARAVKCDDALLLNEANNVSEITSANLFWVKKNKIYTPPLSAGCLEGVTRSVVISDSRKLGLTVSEGNTNLRNLLSADEIFISSSLKLVVGVSQIVTNRTVHRVESGPVTEAVSRYFRHRVGLLPV